MNPKLFVIDVRRFGLIPALIRVVYGRASRVTNIRAYRFLAFAPENVNRKLVKCALPYECRLVESEEARALLRDPMNQIPEEAYVPGTPGEGDFFYGIFDGGKLVNFACYASGPTAVQRVGRISFDPSFLYNHSGYTKPSHRGRNLCSIGVARASHELCADGWRGIVTLIEETNYASLRCANRAGFRSCARAVVLWRDQRSLIWQSHRASRYSLRLSPL
ncbi:MAG: hypothetical protein OEU36_13320 [Gammaproteobacteria bacterium]|nr:hypothetical protein [Gammaproteobacteria bacterium]